MTGIRTHLVLEMMGRPPEHIIQTMEKVVERLNQEKGVMMVSKKIHQPVAVKDSKDLFSTFAELEIEFDSLDAYLAIIFTYMPSHVEVSDPSSIKLTNIELTNVGNGILGRLHMYDSVAKQLAAEREILINKLRAAGLLPAPGQQQRPPAPQTKEQPVQVPETKKNKKSKKKKK